MVRSYVDYAFYGDVIGKSINVVEKSYPIYCKLFGYEEIDNIVNRICNEYDLVIENGVFCK